MKKNHFLFLSYTLLIAYCSLIFYLSSQVFEIPPVPRFTDKFVHIIEYGILGFLVVNAFTRTRHFYNLRISKKWILWAAFLFSFFYGVSDEFHQSHVPGRHFSFYDMLADAFGVAVGIFTYCFLDKAFGKKVSYRKD